MKFRIQWQPAARDELAEMWLAASSAVRRRITVAAREIENILKHEPHDAGESRSGEERIFFAAPLAVLFEIDENDQLVRILKAWRY